MIYDSNHSREEAIAYAIEQAREGTLEFGVKTYIYETSPNRFLVNSQHPYMGWIPMCHVLPNLDVVWIN